MLKNYVPILNPSRGFMIESMQPITNYDIDLCKKILNENQEIVIGIGSALDSHEENNIMTAGERVELVDYVLRNEGIDSNKYILIPIEDIPGASRWVSELRMLTPRWDVAYSRNFRNISMLSSQVDLYNYDVKSIGKQKPEQDYFLMMSKYLKSDKEFGNEIIDDIPNSALKKMKDLGIFDRINVIYNKINKQEHPIIEQKRGLFLGGLQPVTGVYSTPSGHMAAIKKGLEYNDQLIIAVGSAQDSHKDDDPLTAGQRIEILRYALLANGIDSSKFYAIPVKNIDSNLPFGAKVTALSPKFSSIIAGNDWTKILLGQGRYDIIDSPRSTYDNKPISATRIRNIVKDTIKNNCGRDEEINDSLIYKIENNLRGLIDPHAFKMMKEVGFYDMMHFLTFAKE